MKKEWRALRSDRSIVIKKADKASSVEVWDRIDYMKDAKKQLSDENVFKTVEFKEKILTDLVETSS